MNSTASQILDTGEMLIRQRGYNGFAFRELADAVGIKSASVHYHFPTKADLVLAITLRYSERFTQALTGIEQQASDPDKALGQFIKFYRRVVKEEKALTVCMMITHDKAYLPDTIVDALADLIHTIIRWLTVQLKLLDPSLSNSEATDKATLIHSALQGALLGSQAMNDTRYFDRVVRQLRQWL